MEQNEEKVPSMQQPTNEPQLPDWESSPTYFHSLQIGQHGEATESLPDDKSKNEETTEKVRPKKSKPKLGNERSEQTLLVIAVPVDLSFRAFEDLQDLTRGKLPQPRAARIGQIPPRASSNRFLSASIWLSYNNFTNMNGLEGFVKRLLEYPSALTLLDLSFNQITEISPEILSFPELSVLHLQGNKIKCITSVAKLNHLPKLRILSLKGNPMQKIKNYRMSVLYLLPQIKSLDFNLVTKYERNLSAPDANKPKRT